MNGKTNSLKAIWQSSNSPTIKKNLFQFNSNVQGGGGAIMPKTIHSVWQRSPIQRPFEERPFCPSTERMAH